MLKSKKLSKHTIFSWCKSTIRVIGYVAILFNIVVAVCILVLSEILGILEEMDTLYEDTSN